MKPVDVKNSTYIESNKEAHHKNRKFKVDNLPKFKVSKYKNIFAKGYTPSWSEEIF